MGTLFAYVCVYSVYMPTILGDQKRHQNPVAMVTGGYEALCGSWELNLGPLEVQSVLLTTELSFHSQFISLLTFQLVQSKVAGEEWARREKRRGGVEPVVCVSTQHNIIWWPGDCATESQTRSFAQIEVTPWTVIV